MAKKVTPSRQQYLDIKAQYPDCLVFFRLGDFYEMFDDDAATAAKEIDLVLTQRAGIPMAGVPHHAAEGYIAKLIAKGYKVALAEQIGKSSETKGLMPRDVVRVFTAGTVIEEGMLESGKNNYLAGVFRNGTSFGLAYADITTGEFAATQLEDERAVVDELVRLAPAELVVADSELRLTESAVSVSRLPDWRFEIGNAQQTLTQHFNVQTLSSFGMDDKPVAIQAAAAVIHYLNDTQKGAVAQIQRLSSYTLDAYMSLDTATRRNLELTESLAGGKKNSLLGVLDKTVTPMGARLLRERVTRPLLDVAQLNERLDLVQICFEDSLLRADIRDALRGLSDLERLTNRVVSGRAVPRDVEVIGEVLHSIPLLRHLGSPGSALHNLLTALDPCAEASNLIQRALNENAPTNFRKIGVIAKGFSPELDRLMNSSAHAREYIATLEPQERERTGISTLKVGFNKVFGYYIEVTHANTGNVPEEYIRKQTLTNAERYITPEMKEYETVILNAEEQILSLEEKLFGEFCAELAQYAERMLETARGLAQVDVASALAEIASAQAFVRPQLTNDVGLEIVNGRHPVVERTMTLARFVANNTSFDTDSIHLITGPNMSGKSTYLRQVALIALMAQIGSFVPADSATVGLADRIFTRIGAHDELHAGRSTFMVEMVETSQILNHATSRSLLVLDEIGRGTSTYDGLSLAWAIVEYLHDHPQLKPRTLFATHYHELTGLADSLPQVANYNVAVAEEGDNVAFLHQIVAGSANRSYGIHVAQLAGLPKDVVLRAKAILADLEATAPTADMSLPPSHPDTANQVSLFPNANPLADALGNLNPESMTPLDALNTLYEWKQKFS